MQSIVNEVNKFKLGFFAVTFLVIIAIVIITERQTNLIEEIKKAYEVEKKIENTKKIINEVKEEIESNENKNNEDEEFVENESELIKNSLNKGRNSLTIKNKDGHIRYDLDGKTHGEISTPHKHIYKNNLQNGEIKSVSEISESPIPIKNKDIDIIKNYLLKLKK